MGTQQLGAMRADVARIAELRQAPRAAVARTRPSEELLAPIERTLTAAGVDHGRWRDSIPDPPVRLPQSDHRRLRTIVLM